jgi:uncharacterized protein
LGQRQARSEHCQARIELREGSDAVFDSPVVAWNDDREAYGELRINLLGWLNSQLVHMTYTERGEDMHVISLREAEKHEIKRYIKSLAK